MNSKKPNRFVAQVLPRLNAKIDYAIENDMHIVVDMQNINKSARAKTYNDPRLKNHKLQASLQPRCRWRTENGHKLFS